MILGENGRGKDEEGKGKRKAGRGEKNRKGVARGRG